MDDENVLHIEDFKHSTLSWYDHPDTWEFEMQNLVYPIMANKVLKASNIVPSKIVFTYLVFDKGNYKNSAFDKYYRERLTREINIEQGEAKLANIMEEYIMADNLGNVCPELYYPNKNNMCNFCKLKAQCPLYQREYTVSME